MMLSGGITVCDDIWDCGADQQYDCEQVVEVEWEPRDSPFCSALLERFSAGAGKIAGTIWSRFRCQ